MTMKKTAIITVLVAALGTSAAGAVSAAAVTTNNVQTQPFTLFVNDKSVTVRSITHGGVKLVSVRDLGEAVGAKFEAGVKGGMNVYYQGRTIELVNASALALVDGEEQELEAPVVNAKNTFFVELNSFLTALGVEPSVDSQGQVWIDARQKLADVENPVWIKGGSLLVSKLDDAGRIDYKLDTQTGDYKEVYRTVGSSNLTVSPSGDKAAYTDEAGSIYTINLDTRSITQVLADSSIKPELVWSADETSLYFLQGDKGSVIAKVNIADRKVSKLLEDKVDYKANLTVSADGKQFYYTVIKPGAVTADGSKPVDSDDVAIDMTGTEPQVYTYDSSVKESKPVKLTSSSDDKIFVGAAADGTKAFYINSAENQASTLVSVAKDKATKTLIGDKDVAAAVLLGDKLIVLAVEAGVQAVYEVDAAAGTSTKLYNVPDSVTDIIAASSSQIAIVQDGQVLVKNNGQWKKLTK